MVLALIDSETRRWNADLVWSLFLPSKVNTIINMPLSYNLPKDKIIWVGNKGEISLSRALITWRKWANAPFKKTIQHFEMPLF